MYILIGTFLFTDVQLTSVAIDFSEKNSIFEWIILFWCEITDVYTHCITMLLSKKYSKVPISDASDRNFLNSTFKCPIFEP